MLLDTIDLCDELCRIADAGAADVAKRERAASGEYLCDRVARADERPGGEPLLIEVMRNGRRSVPSSALPAVRERSLVQQPPLGTPPCGRRWFSCDAAPAPAGGHSQRLRF